LWQEEDNINNFNIQEQFKMMFGILCGNSLGIEESSHESIMMLSANV
jgi:hypothetical protein